MQRETPDNLRWAAIQLLQNYERCGVTTIARGSDRFLQAWPDASARSESDETSEIPGLGKLDVPSAKSDSAKSSASPSPLPPMPLVPLRSAARAKTLSGESTAITAPGRLEISESRWLGPPLSDVDRQEVFATLREQVVACRKCEELACSRKQIVFGVGKLTPRVVFFGEAPGADEDRMGEPFVGAAGQLLTKIINASQMKRDDVYILNSLKCRPPGNRTPVDIEIENCRPFFEAQLDVLQPEFIVCLGAVAVRAVLQTTESVGRLRGRFHRYRKAQVLVTYHPAYLLRNEGAKKHVWDDMQLLMREMGLSLP